MNRPGRITKTAGGRLLVWSSLSLVALAPLRFVALRAQETPPVQGTIALEGTTKKVYSAVNVVVVETKDGVEHMIHYTKDLLVHGGKGSGVDAMQGLEDG